jgi:hypothetical protein
MHHSLTSIDIGAQLKGQAQFTTLRIQNLGILHPVKI